MSRGARLVAALLVSSAGGCVDLSDPPGLRQPVAFDAAVDLRTTEGIADRPTVQPTATDAVAGPDVAAPDGPGSQDARDASFTDSSPESGAADRAGTGDSLDGSHGSDGSDGSDAAAPDAAIITAMIGDLLDGTATTRPSGGIQLRP